MNEKKLKIIAHGLVTRFIEDYDDTLQEEDITGDDERAFIIMNSILDLVVSVIRNVYCEDHWDSTVAHFNELCIKNLGLDSTEGKTIN